MTQNQINFHDKAVKVYEQPNKKIHNLCNQRSHVTDLVLRKHTDSTNHQHWWCKHKLKQLKLFSSPTVNYQNCDLMVCLKIILDKAAFTFHKTWHFRHTDKFCVLSVNIQKYTRHEAIQWKPQFVTDAMLLAERFLLYYVKMLVWKLTQD